MMTRQLPRHAGDTKPRVIVQNIRVRIRPTSADDLGHVLRLEASPDNAPYVRRWPVSRHRRAMAGPGEAHWVVEAAPDYRMVGYVILSGIDDPDRRLEIVRIVIGEKGKGYGREALHLVKRLAFEHYGVHRLGLDVVEHNQRARQLYLSEGLVEEGRIRDCVRRGDGYLSLVVMSMLEGEYFGKQPRASRSKEERE